MDIDMNRAKQLASEHWSYIAGLLTVHGMTDNEIAQCAYHYQTAFVHGYKHAVEDYDKDHPAK